MVETVQERLRNTPVAFQRGVFGNVALLEEAADLIDALIKERDEVRAAHEVTANDLHRATAALSFKLDELTKLRAERDALMEVVRPFAEIADEIQPDLADSHKNTMAWAVPKVGDLRKARDIRNAIEAAEGK